MWRIALLLLVLSPSSLLAQSIIYVDTDATGANDGSSWENAFVYLQDALAVAAAGDEVWVAEGVYRPDEGTVQIAGDRAAVFLLPSGARVLGGFLGTETIPTQRPDPLAVSLLSGDLAMNDSEDGPTSHLEPSFQENSESVVGGSPNSFNGFTISGGSELAVWLSGDGADCSASNLRITNNVGRRAASFSRCRASDIEVSQNFLAWNAINLGSLAFVSNASIHHNSAAYGAGGGVLFTGSGQAVLSNSLVYGNSAAYGGGVSTYGGTDAWVISTRIVGNRGICGIGGLYIDEFGSLTLVNSLVANNSSEGTCGPSRFQHGGGALAYQASFAVHNSTIVSNSAPGGMAAALAFLESTGVVANSIIASNGSESDVSDLHLANSQIELAYVSLESPLPQEAFSSVTGLISQAPNFLDPSGADGTPGTLDDNYGLAPGSIGIDAGDPLLMPQDIADLDGDGDTEEALPLDLRGVIRTQGASVDLGAFESAGASSREGLPAPTDGCRLVPYPNPASSVFVIPANESAEVTVVDALGRRVALPTRRGSGRIWVDTGSSLRGVFQILVTRAGQHCYGSIILN